jgi:hypothetical protein
MLVGWEASRLSCGDSCIEVIMPGVQKGSPMATECLGQINGLTTAAEVD